MRRLIIIVCVICMGSSLIGCSNHKDSYVSAEKTEVHSSNVLNSSVTDTQGFLQFMKESGYKIETSKINGKGVLSGKLTRVEIVSDTLEIYEYKNIQEMEQDAKRISTDGSVIEGGGIYEWKATPHFYKGGNIIVFYLGDNKGIMDKIEQVMGKQFASWKFN
jgi:hypothetical protein